MLIVYIALMPVAVVFSHCPGPSVPPPIKCGINEEYADCKITCPPQFCNNSYTDYGICPNNTKCEPGCNCKTDYLRDFKGVCVFNEKCPPPIICGENEVAKACKRTCPPDTCDFDSEREACKPYGCEPGCNCIENYLRDSNGKCIPKKQCPKKPTTCDKNSTYIDCPTSCPSTCRAPNEKYCEKKCEPNGCQCKPSYLLSKPKGECILPTDCPGGYPCPQNETFTACNIRCPNSYCPVDDSLAILICDPAYRCPSGCSCKQNHLRKSLKDTRCILASECPPVKCTRPNEEWKPCTTICLKENCNDLKLKDTACKPSKSYCKPKCACKDGFYRNESMICVPAAECFPPPIKCGINEEYADCKITCPPQFCNNSYTEYGVCPNNTKCEPGCNCKKDYLRDFNGVCVFNEECPAPIICGENEVAKACKRTCPPDTCDFDSEREACKPYGCEPGCNCIENYLRDSNGKCIPKNQCPNKPTTCDKNSTYIDCPSPCPSTCRDPNEEYCKKQCKTNGCQCKPSYLLSKPKGECILPTDCPGGYPCPQNETFTACNIRCPNSYCPVDDSLGILICDPPYRCPSGCSCKQNHLRKSLKDTRCILASECPPVKCTRPNEEWKPCTTICLKENCNDLKLKETACKPSKSYCKPKCACKDGFYRNESMICVPAAECFPSETCDVPYECRATCAEPNPKNCPNGIASKNIKGCKCQPGFILSEKDGECIKIEDCPPQLGCNGDFNATIKQCPPPCPSTCQTPNETPCRKRCLDVGCRCKDGFILSKLNGMCVNPEDCSGGNPCGSNATFLSCRNRCPYNYCPVDDSQTVYDCSPPSPCPSGCVCKLNHRIKSRDENTCIVSSECPPVNCTRPNEVWDSCPLDCLRQDCENAGEPPVVCNTFVLNCQPNCICKPNTFKDQNKICIPAEECPKRPPPISDPIPTCGEK